MDVVAFLTNVFVFWYFAFAAVVLLVLLRDRRAFRGMLRNQEDAPARLRVERVAGVGAPTAILFLYVIHVVDGWDAALDAGSLPDLPEAYLAILGSVNTLYVARKMRT